MTDTTANLAPVAIYFDLRLNRWEPVRYPWKTPRDFMAEYDEILARWGRGGTMIAITPENQEDYHPGPMICPECGYQWWVMPASKCGVCGVPMRPIVKEDLEND